jgi:hypothetical protein
MNPVHYNLIEDTTLKNEKHAVRTINAPIKPEINTPRDKHDLFKYSDYHGGDGFGCLYLEPAEVLIYKAQNHTPNTYLPIREVKMPNGDHFNYTLDTKVDKYFLERMLGTPEADLYQALKYALGTRRSDKSATTEADDTSQTIEAIQNYFIGKLQDLNQPEENIPEAVAILRRTAIAMYKSLRYPPLKEFHGGEKVVITGIGREKTLQADSLINKITKDTATWNGVLNPINPDDIRNEAEEAIEAPTNQQLARAYSKKSWKEKLNPFNKGRLSWGDLHGEYNSPAPIAGFKVIERLKEEFNNPRWLPNVLKPLKPRNPEQDRVRIESLNKHPKANKTKSVNSYTDSYYMEFLPNKVFNGDQNENAKDLLQIAEIINQMKLKNRILFDLKPNNFGKRANNEICLFDVESVAEYRNWNNKVNALNIPDLNPSITAFYAAPELIALNSLADIELLNIRIDLEKSIVYSLGAMLFTSQYKNEYIPNIGYTYKYKNGKLESTPINESSFPSTDININIRMLENLPNNKYKDLLIRSLVLNQDERISLEKFLEELKKLTQ